MPGLFASIPSTNRTCDVDAFAKGLTALSHVSGTVRQVHAATRLQVAVHQVSPLSPSVASSRQTHVFVDGLLFPRGSTGDAREDGSAQHALALYERHGETFLDHVNGEFNLIIRDHARRCTIIANDRFGLRPWYTLKTKEALWLSPTPRGLLKAADTSPELDFLVLAGFLTFNKMRLGDRTIFKDISVVPPASLWIQEDGRSAIKKKTTWVLHYEDNPGENADVVKETIHSLVDTYSRAMSQRAAPAPDRRVGILLSGGLDSRSMVGALSPVDRAQIHSHTYGLPESDEVQLAARVAAAAGVPHHIQKMTADTYVEHAHRSPFLNGELDIFVQAAQHDWLRPLSENTDVIMTGLDLDVSLGGIYMVPEVLSARSDQDILDVLRAKNRIFPSNEIHRLFGTTLSSYSQAPFEVALELIRELPQESFPVKYDHFIHRYSMRRIIFSRYAQLRHYMETATPMTDYDFLDEVLRLPYLQRAGHRVFHPFINQLCPDLCAIPYQRTTLPATVPPDFWKEAARIETDREALYTRIYQETDGKIQVPYRRYYSNFEEWLRMDPGWVQLAEDLLAPSAQIFERGLVKASFVSECLGEHRAAKRNRRQQLVCLMSLELFLRAHF